jgi:ribosome maturation factor RimP
MPTWPIASIKELLEPTLNHMGYDIYAVEQSGAGGKTLRIAIDRPQGITLDDCERVSQVVGPLLDQADLIPGPYTLEVSSPGAERPLRDRSDFDRFLGKKAHVRYRFGDGEAVIEGVLAAVDDAGFAIRGRKNEFLHLDWGDLISARLVASL